MMNDSNKYYSNIQESKIANYLNWNKVSGSGARAFHPGDLENDKWLGECKTHKTSSSKLKFLFSHWDKLEEEAISQFKQPVLFVDNGTQNIYNTYVMIKIPDRFLQDDYFEYDYSNKQSISFDINCDNFPIFFKRDNCKYSIIPLSDFKNVKSSLE